MINARRSLKRKMHEILVVDIWQDQCDSQGKSIVYQIESYLDFILSNLHLNTLSVSVYTVFILEG